MSFLETVKGYITRRILPESQSSLAYDKERELNNKVTNVVEEIKPPNTGSNKSIRKDKTFGPINNPYCTPLPLRLYSQIPLHVY